MENEDLMEKPTTRAVERDAAHRVDILWCMQAVGDLEGMLEFARDPDVDVRQQLVRALGKKGPCQSIDHVVEFRNDPSPKVRDEVVLVLYRCLEVERLKLLCQDSDRAIRRKVARAFGFLKSFDGVVQMVHDQDVRTRIEVVRSFHEIDGFGPILWLFRMAHDDNIEVFKEVAWRLKHLGQTDQLMQLIDVVTPERQAIIAEYLSLTLAS